MLRSRHSKRHEQTGENEPTKRKKKGAYTVIEYCKCIEPPVRRNEPLNARNRASYCEQESRPTIFTYRTNLLYNEVACLRA